MSTPRRKRYLTRSTLAWTLAAMALATAPHVFHVPAWPMICVALGGVWRWLALTHRWRLPGALLRVVLAVAGFMAVFTAYSTINGVDAGTALLIVMMALKLTETATTRDLVVLLYIALFLVVASFLYDQSPWSLAWAIPSVWLATAALLQVSRENTATAALPALRTSGGLLLQALPVMLIMWVLFPRVPGPFWSLPTASASSTTGLSDEMSPGSITELLTSRAVAFRADFTGPLPPPSERYWRGPVLRDFNGGRWKARQASVFRPGTLRNPGSPVNYTVYLEAHERRWLFALDVPNPSAVPRFATLSSEMQLTSRMTVSTLLRYDMQSFAQYEVDADLPDWSRHFYLVLPEARNPRTAAMAQRWARQTNNDAALVERALNLFRQQPFYYTLRPPALDVNAHPVDEFLFETRRGFCEHFASAFAVLMRAAGIPSRIVTGYLGGTENPFNGQLTVRQSDAHAWTEVWLSGRGWVRVDPTGAVAPDRIEYGIDSALPDGEALPGFNFGNSAMLMGMRNGWDALASKWNEWILGYGKDTQGSFMRWLGLNDPSLRNLILMLTALVTGALVLLSAVLAWRARPPAPDPLVRAYARFCQRLGRHGITRSQTEGPLDYARRAARSYPHAASEIDTITAMYVALRYETAPTDGDLAQFRRRVRHFRPPTRA